FEITRHLLLNRILDRSHLIRYQPRQLVPKRVRHLGAQLPELFDVDWRLNGKLQSALCYRGRTCLLQKLREFSWRGKAKSCRRVFAFKFCLHKSIEYFGNHAEERIDFLAGTNEE